LVNAVDIFRAFPETSQDSARTHGIGRVMTRDLH
jgi:hypothetical protein